MQHPILLNGVSAGIEKNAQRRCKHCVLALVRQNQKFSPHCRPPSLGCEMVKISSARDGHYLYLQTQSGEDQCTQFRIIVVTEHLQVQVQVQCAK